MLYTRAMGRMGLTGSKQIAYKSNKIHGSQKQYNVYSLVVGYLERELLLKGTDNMSNLFVKKFDVNGLVDLPSGWTRGAGKPKSGRNLVLTTQ